jgi:Tfp pilus assembly protein PilN
LLWFSPQEIKGLGMIKINLIPQEYLKKMESSILIAKILIGSFLFAVIIALISLWQVVRATTLSIELSSKNLEYTSLKDDVKQAEDIKGKINEITNYINAINTITKNRYIYVAFMQDIVNNLPPNIWFSGIETKSSGNTLSITLNLSSGSLYEISWLLLFFENNKRFQNVAIGNIAVAESANGNIYTTQFTANYVYE